MFKIKLFSLGRADVVTRGMMLYLATEIGIIMIVKDILGIMGIVAAVLVAHTFSSTYLSLTLKRIVKLSKDRSFAHKN